MREEGNISKVYSILFLCYSIFVFFNVVIHIVNYYFGFLGSIEEYIFSVAKLTLCIAIYCKTNSDENVFKAIRKLIKWILICDFFEIFISITMTEIEGFAFGLLIALFCVKAGLDFFFWVAIIDKAVSRKKWIYINLGIILSVVTICFLKWTVYVFFVLLFTRFIYELVILRNSSFDLSTGVEGEKEHKHFTVKKYVYAIIIIAFLMFLIWLRYSIPAGKYTIKNGNESITVNSSCDSIYQEKENIYEYVVYNRMPAWSGFRKEWWGIVNTDNGIVTEAKFSYLYYDSTGIAWDCYSGSFIDYNGEKVIKMPSAVIDECTSRTRIFNNVFDILLDSDQGCKSVFDWIIDRITCGFDYGDFCGDNYIEWQGYSVEHCNLGQADEKYYFKNHVAVYYSENNGAYGLMNDEGEIVTKPSFTDFISYNNNQFFMVEVKRSGKNNVLNYQGNYILDMHKHWAEIEIDRVSGMVACRETNYGPLLIFNDLGIQLNEDSNYLYCNMDRGDVVCLTKDSEDYTGSSYVALIKDGTELYESNVYSDYYGYEDEDGQVKFLFAYNYNNGSSYWRLIDLINNKEVGEQYESIRIFDDRYGVESPFALCSVSSTSINQIQFFNGKNFELAYDFVEFDIEKQLIKVSKTSDSGDTLYNYYDLDGSLVSDEWTLE